MHFRPRVPASRLVVLALVLAGGCADSAPPTAEPLAPVLVIGFDGLEWSVMRPLLAAGRLPNMAALMERGAFGKLGTFKPTWSPVVWTSIATGKELRDHGVLSFLDPQGREYTSSRREGRALWNIADAYGLKTNVFGWWITWPVEAINGVMVSATSASALVADNWKPALIEGLGDQVHPPELTERVMAVAREVGAEDNVRRVAREHVFGPVDTALLGPLEKTIMGQTLWSILSDATYLRLATELIPEHPADLNLVYFGGTDVVGHRFWRQYEPEAFAYAGSNPQVDAALAGVIPRYYEWADEMVAQLLTAVGEDVTVFIVSDHGMHAVAVDAPNNRHTTGDHQDGAPGVIIAAGPGIERQGRVDQFIDSGALPTHGSVLAVAPTVLGLLGIPASRQMAARPYKSFLTDAARAKIDALELVDTHDEGFRETSVVEVPAEMEQEYTEKFKALGYMDGGLDHSGESELVNPDGFHPDPSATSAGKAPADEGDQR